MKGAGCPARWVLLVYLLGPELAAAASGGPLTLEATPRQLQARHDEATILTVRGPAEQLLDVRLSCTPGAAGELRRVGPRELQARYVQSKAREPAWVLCAAVSPRSAFAVARMELQRRELLALEELPPLGRVEAKLGNRLYGPVRANAAGRAELPVILSPTVHQAELRVTPPGGATSSRPHPLALPPAEQLLLVSGSSSLLADGSRGVPVWLFMLGKNGELQDLPVRLEATAGRKPVLRRVARGVRTGMFVPYAHSSEGVAVLTARLKHGRSTALRIVLEGGVRPLLSIEAPVRGLPADGLATVDMLIRVTDRQGRGLAGLVPRIRATAGTVGPPEARAPGVFAASFTAPASRATEALVAAELPDTEPVSILFNLTPPPRLSLRADPLEVPADGQSRVAIRVMARGPDGHPLPDGTPVQVRTTLGAAPDSVHISGGQARVHLVAGKRAGEAIVQVQALEVTERVVVRFLPGAPARLTLRPIRRAVQCDGKDRTAIRISLQDANGNGLDSAPIELAASGASEAELGELGPVSALGGGEFSVHYWSPARCVPGPIDIEASSGSVRGTTRLVRVPAFGPIGLTARVGAHLGSGAMLSSVIEVEADAHAAFLASQLLASISFKLAFGVLEASAPGMPWARGSLSVVSLYAGPRWDLLETDRLVVYVGAGLDGHLVQVISPMGGPVQVGPAVGAHLRAGVGHALGPGSVVLQARYDVFELAPPEIDDHVGGVAMDLGYRMAF